MKTKQGFAALSREEMRKIASEGGRTAHERGTAHEWTPEAAAAAGRRGGEKVSQNRAYMAAIGRRGGIARAERLERDRMRELWPTPTQEPRP